MHMNSSRAAVILAGGRAARLDGVDKAAIRVGGIHQLDRVLAAEIAAIERIVVGPVAPRTPYHCAQHAGADPHPARPPEFRAVLESPRFGGPALALRAGVEALATEPDLVDVLAVDLRHPAAVVAALDAQPLHPDSDGVLLRVDGRAQYLAARIRLAPLRRALATVTAGDSLRRAYAALHLDERTASAPLADDFDTLDDIRDGGAELPTAPRIGATMAELPEGLDSWNDHCAAALGLDPAEVPLQELLSMTGVVAHSVVRPAAPITAYLVGLAAGRGTIDSVDAGIAQVRELAREWEHAAGVESGE